VSTLRQASARFIEAGRALGRVEALKSARAELITLVGELPSAADAEQQDIINSLQKLSKKHAGAIGLLEAEAKRAQEQAHELMHRIEHPGARLARRLVMAVRAARRAWVSGR
jgi:hypothetical protein